MSKHAELLPVYKRLRQAGLLLNQKLVKALATETLKEGARKLGILRNDIFVFDSEEESHVLMDYCIFNVYRDGLNAIQRYLAESPPPRDSDEMLVLQARLRAHYSLFQVTEVEPGVGILVRDVLRDETNFLVDVGLGSSISENDVFASRVIPFHGYLTTGGAGMPVSKAVADTIANKLQPVLGPATSIRRLTPEQETDLATLIIRACLESGMGSRIAYGEPGQRTSPSRQTREARSIRAANRNDPCPCGSGRKYKTCCGRRPLR
jgi:hypothetical protein